MKDALHIHGQQQWHDEAVIIGTPSALFALRDVLNKAVSSFMDDLGSKHQHNIHTVLPPIGTASNQSIKEPKTLFTSDGEGYQVSVVCIDEDNGHWGDLALPYHDQSMFKIRPTEEYWSSSLGGFVAHGPNYKDEKPEPERGVYISRQDAQALVKFFDSDNPHHLTVKAMQAAQKIKKSLSMVSDEDIKHLIRFHETTEDNEAYDVPKVIMKRLANIGLIGHASAGRYFITDFGQSVIDAEIGG